MEMPALGQEIKVRATRPNVERHPARGRMFEQNQEHTIVVTAHIVSRLRDGSLVWMDPPRSKEPVENPPEKAAPVEVAAPVAPPDSPATAPTENV